MKCERSQQPTSNICVKHGNLTSVLSIKAERHLDLAYSSVRWMDMDVDVKLYTYFFVCCRVKSQVLCDGGWLNCLALKQRQSSTAFESSIC